MFCAVRLEGHGCWPRRPLVPMIGIPGRCWCGGCRRFAASSEMTGNCRAGDAGAGLTGSDGLVSLCVQKDEASIQHRTEASSSSIAAGSASLLRGEVLEDQGILGGNEIAERHLVKRKLPEERENPVVVNLRSAWQANLLDFPAASLADRVADVPDQSLFGVVFEVRWDGERADRAHRYVLDPAILAHRFVR